MHRGQRPIVVALFLVLAGCDSPTTPTAPELTSPIPDTRLPLPVDAANVVFVPAPAVPPSSATDPIVGRYTLDLVIGSRSGPRCETVPEHARRRTYTADIHAHGDSYAVQLYDATFLADGTRVGYGCRDRRLPVDGVCHQFLITRDGSETLFVNIVPEDEWRGSEIWEVLVQDGRLLQIHGQATGTARDGRIEAAGTGGLWYGNGLPATISSGCGPGDLYLNFARR